MVPTKWKGLTTSIYSDHPDRMTRLIASKPSENWLSTCLIFLRHHLPARIADSTTRVILRVAQYFASVAIYRVGTNSIRAGDDPIVLLGIFGVGAVVL